MKLFQIMLLHAVSALPWKKLSRSLRDTGAFLSLAGDLVTGCTSRGS
jgi:hypothetical protein